MEIAPALGGQALKNLRSRLDIDAVPAEFAKTFRDRAHGRIIGAIIDVKTLGLSRARRIQTDIFPVLRMRDQQHEEPRTGRVGQKGVFTVNRPTQVKPHSQAVAASLP
jgi:hypothetical protein